jgi:hypothetical protein
LLFFGAIAWLSFVNAATKHRGPVIGTQCRYPGPGQKVCGPFRGRDRVLLGGGQAALMIVLDVVAIVGHLTAREADE